MSSGTYNAATGTDRAWDEPDVKSEVETKSLSEYSDTDLHNEIKRRRIDTLKKTEKLLLEEIAEIRKQIEELGD